MINMKKIILICFILAGSVHAWAQSYVPNVSKDSVGILNAKVDVLKAKIKVIELKMEEAEEEADVEKLRIKLAEANDEAEQSAEKASKHTNRSGGGDGLDLKEVNKLAKQAKNNREDAIKALERFNKQIAKVMSLREEIQKEERKLRHRKPQISFDYK